MACSSKSRDRQAAAQGYKFLACDARGHPRAYTTTKGEAVREAGRGGKVKALGGGKGAVSNPGNTPREVNIPGAGRGHWAGHMEIVRGGGVRKAVVDGRGVWVAYRRVPGPDFKFAWLANVGSSNEAIGVVRDWWDLNRNPSSGAKQRKRGVREFDDRDWRNKYRYGENWLAVAAGDRDRIKQSRKEDDEGSAQEWKAAHAVALKHAKRFDRPQLPNPGKSEFDRRAERMLNRAWIAMIDAQGKSSFSNGIPVRIARIEIDRLYDFIPAESKYAPQVMRLEQTWQTRYGKQANPSGKRQRKRDVRRFKFRNPSSGAKPYKLFCAVHGYLTPHTDAYGEWCPECGEDMSSSEQSYRRIWRDSPEMLARVKTTRQGRRDYWEQN